MRDGCIRKLKQTTCSGNENPKVYDVVPFPVQHKNRVSFLLTVFARVSRWLSLCMRSPVVEGIHVYIIRYKLIKLLIRKSIFLSQLDSCTRYLSF